jgi:hypothetical protein
MTDENNSSKDASESAQGASIGKTEPKDTGPYKPATEADLDKVEERMSAFERSTLRWTVASFFVILATAIFICLQWLEMRSGGKDTHDLADAAKTQADRLEDLVKGMKEQAANTLTLGQAAQSANTIAKTASTAVQRAFIVVDTLNIYPVRMQNGAVKSWIVNPVVTNSGNTPTVNLYFQIGFGSSTDMSQWPVNKEPPYDNLSFPSLPQIRTHHEWQRGVIGPHASVTNLTVLNGFEADSLHGPGNWASTGEFTWGAFIYGDVFDKRPHHITEFCFVMYRTTMVFDQFAPYGRCNHHNCADKECEAEEGKNPN